MTINFNEGGSFSRWVPFCLAINLMNLRFFLYVVYPWPIYGFRADRLEKEKHWFLGWKKLFSITIYKSK